MYESQLDFPIGPLMITTNRYSGCMLLQVLLLLYRNADKYKSLVPHLAHAVIAEPICVK